MKMLEDKCPKCGGLVLVNIQQGTYMLVTGGPTYRMAVQATRQCMTTSLDYCGWNEKSKVVDVIFEFGD
jgi:hypothetical protein